MLLVCSQWWKYIVSSKYKKDIGSSKFPDFSLIFEKNDKFPDFSLTGKMPSNFPWFPWFPEVVGALHIVFSANLDASAPLKWKLPTENFRLQI